MTHNYQTEKAAWGADSLCLTYKGHALCGTCYRAAPGKMTKRHLLRVPATCPKRCRMYRPGQPNLEES
jgi:hypothetical protein